MENLFAYYKTTTDNNKLEEKELARYVVSFATDFILIFLKISNSVST